MSFHSIWCPLRLSLYLSVTGGNDWSMYYAVMVQIGSFYPAVFLSYTFFFIFAPWLQIETKLDAFRATQ